MKAVLKKLVLTGLPRRTGNAGCAPDSYYEYRCEAHYYYRRSCYTPQSCGADICGPWASIGGC